MGSAASSDAAHESPPHESQHGVLVFSLPEFPPNLHGVPVDVADLILTLLALRDVRALGATCQSWRRIIMKSVPFWRQQYERLASAPLPQGEDASASSLRGKVEQLARPLARLDISDVLDKKEVKRFYHGSFLAIPESVFPVRRIRVASVSAGIIPQGVAGAVRGRFVIGKLGERESDDWTDSDSSRAPHGCLLLIDPSVSVPQLSRYIDQELKDLPVVLLCRNARSVYRNDLIAFCRAQHVPLFPLGMLDEEASVTAHAVEELLKLLLLAET